MEENARFFLFIVLNFHGIGGNLRVVDSDWIEIVLFDRVLGHFEEGTEHGGHQGTATGDAFTRVQSTMNLLALESIRYHLLYDWDTRSSTDYFNVAEFYSFFVQHIFQPVQCVLYFVAGIFN